VFVLDGKPLLLDPAFKSSWTLYLANLLRFFSPAGPTPVGNAEVIGYSEPLSLFGSNPLGVEFFGV
jgi:hypothetical protein